MPALSSDVVVVGAGPAGLALTVHAADRGLDVTLVEAAEDIGGALPWSGGHLSAAGTRRQAERGIADSVEAHLADIERISRGTARPGLTRRAVEEAVPTLEWLDDLGLELDPATPRIVHGHEQYSVPRTVHGTNMALGILEVLRAELERVVADGRVTVLLGTRVTSLVAAGERVVGVRLAGGDQVLGDEIVLATGGFGHEPELFAELEGVPLVTSSAPTSTGDGIRLGRSVGAGIAGRGMYIPTFGGLPPEGDDLRVDWVHRPHLVAPERPPWEIYVDRGGRRWVAEDEPSIDAKERALTTIEDMTFWTVFDAHALASSHPMVMGWSADELDAAAGVRRGVTKAATLEELAAAAGIDADGLLATVERYNGFVDAGRDDALGRTHLPARIEQGPFYALENHPVTLITFAGLSVDDDLRVLREDGSVIEGLHAVGEVIGSAAVNGNSFCSGMCLTPALALGRRLGLDLSTVDAVGTTTKGTH
ncbi:MAG: FAD-dependent oxidoreductase [Candidatus Nanopelagicales bacterium]